MQRRRLVAVGAIALGAALVPTAIGVSVPRAPLKFRQLARGSATGGALETRTDVGWFGSAHSTYGGADNFARLFGLGAAAVKAVDVFDYNHHFVVYVLRREHPVRVRKLLFRRLNPSRLQLCIFVRDDPGTTRQAYGFQAVWVRKTFGINHVVPAIDNSFAVIFDGRGRVVYPLPVRTVRPSLCR